MSKTGKNIQSDGHFLKTCVLWHLSLTIPSLDGFTGAERETLRGNTCYCCMAMSTLVLSELMKFALLSVRVSANGTVWRVQIREAE